jgi:hypothetical protein
VAGRAVLMTRPASNIYIDGNPSCPRGILPGIADLRTIPLFVNFHRIGHLGHPTIEFPVAFHRRRTPQQVCGNNFFPPGREDLRRSNVSNGKFVPGRYPEKYVWFANNLNKILDSEGEFCYNSHVFGTACVPLPHTF